LSSIVTVTSAGDNELVLSSRSGRQINLRVNTADFGSNATDGAELAIEMHAAWQKVISAISEDHTGVERESADRGVEGINDMGVQMKPVFRKEPEVVLSSVHDMAKDLTGTDNPLVVAKEKVSFKLSGGQREHEHARDGLPPVVRSFLVLLGLAPPRFGPFSGDTRLSIERGLSAMYCARAAIASCIVVVSVLEVVILVGHGDLSRACRGAASFSFSSPGDDDADDGDESNGSKRISLVNRCDAQIILCIPVVLDTIGTLVIYAWMVARVNEKVFLPSHRHRLNDFLSTVARRMFFSWIIITILVLIISQLPDCPQFDSLREQLRGTLHTFVIGPVYYGFVFIYYSETCRLRCIAQDFEALLEDGGTEGDLEQKGHVSRMSSRLSASRQVPHTSDAAVIDWAVYLDAYQRCRGEFDSVQNLIGNMTSFYIAETIIWLVSGVFHSYVAETLAETTLYTVVLVGAVLPMIFVLYAMASVNRAGGDLTGYVAFALAKSSRQPPADCGGVKLLLVAQALPCSLTSLGRKVVSGDLAGLIFTLFITQLVAAFNVSSTDVKGY